MNNENLNIPIPAVKFEKFFKKHETIRDVVSTKEWDEIYKHYFEFTDNELDIKIHETKEEIEAYSQEKQIKEIIKCVNDFAYFCTKYVKINHPIHGLIPFIMYSYQRRTIDGYDSHRFNILRKFRQGGLTTVSVAWALWRALFKTDQRILVMSKTDREAIAAGDVVKNAMFNLPSWMKPEMGKHNEHERQFLDTGSVIWFYTPEAARGKSITVLIIDEAAFIQDMHKHWKSMYPVISTGGQCCVISTVNGLGNWYEEIYHEAEAGKNAFNIINLHYSSHPDYNDPTWVKSTKANLGAKGWRQEVLGDFLGSGETYINGKVIKELDNITRENYPLRIKFQKWLSVTKDRDQNEEDTGALWIWQEPKDNHEYIIGSDCAEGVGEGGDNSAFEILDMTTLEQVAEFYSNTIPPHIYAQVLNEIGYYYNTALLVVENVGQGGAVLSNLQHDLAYENIYFEPKSGKPKAGVTPNRIKRPIYLEALQHRIINGSVKINSHRLVSELSTFIYNPRSKKAEARKGKHDDLIISMALAIWVRDSQIRGIPVGADAPDEITKIFKSSVYEEIKREILEDSPEDWLGEKTSDPILMPDDEDILSGISFDFRRKNENLLKEFGW